MEQKQSTQVKKLLFDIKQENQRKSKKIIVYGFPFFVAFIAVLVFYFPKNPGSNQPGPSNKIEDKNKIHLDQQRFFKQYTRFLRRKHGAILHSKETGQISSKQKEKIDSYTTFLLEFRVFNENLFLSLTKQYSALFNTRLKIRSKEVNLESTTSNYAYEIDFIKKSKLFIQITVPYKTVIKKKPRLQIDPPQKIKNPLQEVTEKRPRIKKVLNNAADPILQKTDRINEESISEEEIYEEEIEEESISEEEIYEEEMEEEISTTEESTIDEYESEPETADYEGIDDVETENLPLEEVYKEKIPETENLPLEEAYIEEIPETENLPLEEAYEEEISETEPEGIYEGEVTTEEKEEILDEKVEKKDEVLDEKVEESKELEHSVPDQVEELQK